VSLANRAIDWSERGRVPDAFIRVGIRRLLKDRLRTLGDRSPEAARIRTARFVESMRSWPIADLPAKANEQHYEVPAEFFRWVLGPHRKYSSGWWPEGVASLAAAEAASLRETCAHAELADGQRILELGCGWGSLTLWMAEHYPSSQIVAISNSVSQGEFIMSEARHRGLGNIEHRVADMNTFSIPGQFDRVVSIEMFEHMRNWPALLARIAAALNPSGKLLLHVFCHRSVPYLFDDRDGSDWMSRYFFSGGIMPSDTLPSFLQDSLQLSRTWRWEGTHYQRTAHAWLENLDAHRDRVMPILRDVYGQGNEQIWLQRWRMFFMACEELFGYAGGQEWWVAHALFAKPVS